MSGSVNEVVEVFNRAASSYDSHGPRLFAELGRRLVDGAGVAAGAKVLDVACGKGAVLFPAADRVGPRGKVTGIDLAENMVLEAIAEINRTGRSNIEILTMDADRLSFPDATFDFVFCGFALWLFREPRQASLEFFRVLKPGGRLALSTWASDSPYLAWVRQEIAASLPSSTDQPTKAPTSPSLGSAAFGAAPQIATALRETGFADIDSRMEVHDFVYADEEEWWASLWGQGLRSQFEALDAQSLEVFKADMIREARRLTGPDGLRTRWHPLFTQAIKPRAPAEKASRQ